MGDVVPENDGKSKRESLRGCSGISPRSHPMKNSRFSEEQMAYAIRQAVIGVSLGWPR